MTTTPLIVGGNFKIGATDFSDAVTSVQIMVDSDEVEIPATLAGPKSTRKGGNKYSLKISFLSNDLAAEMFKVIYDDIDTGDGQLAFTLQFRDGVVSATNPQWAGTMVCTHAAVGGDAEGLSTDEATYPLTGKPVITTS